MMAEEARELTARVALVLGIEGAVSQHAIDLLGTLEEYRPLTCHLVGHQDLPQRFLRRFRTRAWVCTRCSAVMRTRLHSSYGGTAWLWEQVSRTEQPFRVLRDNMILEDPDMDW